MILNFRRRTRSSFAKDMLESFPSGMTVPDALIQFFHWLERRQLDRRGGHDGKYVYATIDVEPFASCIEITPVDPAHVAAWTRFEPSLASEIRLAPFCRTGGDGSYAALWIDDSGAPHIVHLGSGSGSTMMGVLADDAVDFLRLLAIGYEELCWPDHFDRTPKEIYDAQGDCMEPFNEPVNFQRWVSDTFDVTVPSTASEIVAKVADMDAEESDDPFWRWIRANVWE